jgi:hypothetical protein
LPRNGGELVVNELNTMPGLTEVSGYPKMWEASGLPFPRLLETLIDSRLNVTKTSRLRKLTIKATDYTDLTDYLGAR